MRSPIRVTAPADAPKRQRPLVLRQTLRGLALREGGRRGGTTRRQVEPAWVKPLWIEKIHKLDPQVHTVEQLWMLPPERRRWLDRRARKKVLKQLERGPHYLDCKTLRNITRPWLSRSPPPPSLHDFLAVSFTLHPEPPALRIHR